MRGHGEVLVVDGDAALRRDLVARLERDGLRAWGAKTAEESLERVGLTTPALVLLEVNLPGTCGYELLRRLRDLFGDRLPIVLMSKDRTEPFDRVGGMLLGADDYIVKPFSPDEVLARVRRLLRFSPRSDGGRHGLLTGREREVLELLAEGRSQREIATALVISPKTCAKHIERILEKLGVHSRAQAVAVVYRDGLLEGTALVTGRSPGR